ncbi:HTH domain-containing protein [Weissella cibaria]|uniref:HTH domain-containing protein n=1 Tax=Weissella cibaria TaxID=137591 RepID=UPI00119640EC|nr:HTH domain-containing protein [Weissella cibaria]TVV32473.1 HTH domain-containing protein [Weissella cibaria]
MKAIITKDQQLALLRIVGEKRLTQTELAEKLGITRMTLRRVIDEEAPLVVNGKTFTAVNNYLISELIK